MSQDGAGFPNLTGVRVLVVEDNADTRQLFCTVLRSCGAEARGTDSTEGALRALITFNPDVLVVDIGLPGEDGYSLIRRLRARPPGQGGNVPAMAVTAYTQPQDRARALWRGFQMHVPKPVEPDELARRVAKLVGPHDESKVA